MRSGTASSVVFHRYLQCGQLTTFPCQCDCAGDIPASAHQFFNGQSGLPAENLTVLDSAYSENPTGRSGEKEPVLLTIKYAKYEHVSWSWEATSSG